MNLGEKLKKLRTEKGMSQKAVADLTGVHANSYGQYERGIRKPDAETVKKLAQALGCEEAYLTAGTESVKKSAEGKGEIRQPRGKFGGLVKHIFEIDGNQVSTDEILDRIQEVWKEEGHRAGSVKKLDIYYNFAERRAYYVINDNPEDRFVEF